MAPRAKWYVGLKTEGPIRTRSMKRWTDPPNFMAYGYRTVIGPFKTRAGAEYFKNHSECRSVQEAEYNAAMAGQPLPYVRPALGWE